MTTVGDQAPSATAGGQAASGGGSIANTTYNYYGDGGHPPPDGPTNRTPRPPTKWELFIGPLLIILGIGIMEPLLYTFLKYPMSVPFDPAWAVMPVELLAAPITVVGLVETVRQRSRNRLAWVFGAGSPVAVFWGTCVGLLFGNDSSVLTVAQGAGWLNVLLFVGLIVYSMVEGPEHAS